jgi:thiol-disulfide isomerase/thioredoxin
MLRPIPVLCALLAALMPLAAGAQPAALGDAAPELQLGGWVKGEAVTLAALKDKKVAVVEFWATWCPPCRQSIPELTRIQEKHKDAAVLIGVSSEPIETVKPFVEKMGDTMGYHVAVDADNAMAKAYMEAYGQQGIPTAFIVDRAGKVAWVGNPLDPRFEQTLDQVVGGTYDLAKAKAEMERRAKMEQAVQEYFTLSEQGEDKARVAALGKELLAYLNDDANLLSALAWQTATYPGLAHRDLEVAEKAALRARALTEDKDADVLDTHARVLVEQGKVAEGIAVQKQAVEIAPAELRQSLEANLAAYEEALANRAS